MQTGNDDQSSLERLLNAAHPCISIVTQEERHALELVQAAVLGSQRPLWVWSIVGGVSAGIFEDDKSLPNTENPAAALYHFANQMVTPGVCVMLDLCAHLSDERTLRALREAIHEFRVNGGCLILIDHSDQLPAVIVSEVTRLDLSLPDVDELERIIRRTIRRLNRENRAIQARLSKGEFQTMLRNLRGLTRLQAEQIIIDAVASDSRLDANDMNSILAHKRQKLHRDGVLEYVETPVDLSEIVGLNCLKQWLKHRQNALSDEAVAFGLTPPRGVLLLGVQGAGKSLSAKAIATAWQRPLLRLDPGALYDRYIGESERRLREALRQAEMMAPIVLWIDEIEKGFASAASRSVDGGLSQRMFGSLLTWMQEHKAPVFLIATANDIDALPPELLRKGRFDEIFFIDLPSEDVRRDIFAIHLKKRGRNSATFDLDALAKASPGFSGAEVEQAVIAALHEAFSTGKDLATDGILSVVRRSPPLSVTMAERIAALREWAQGRCVPAD